MYKTKINPLFICSSSLFIIWNSRVNTNNKSIRYISCRMITNPYDLWSSTNSHVTITKYKRPYFGAIINSHLLLLEHIHSLLTNAFAHAATQSAVVDLMLIAYPSWIYSHTLTLFAALSPMLLFLLLSLPLLLPCCSRLSLLARSTFPAIYTGFTLCQFREVV